jgi:hypothetical protein
LHDERDRYAAMKTFVDRQMRIKITGNYLFTTDGKSDGSGPEKTNRPVIYRIIIDEKTGQYQVN